MAQQGERLFNHYTCGYCYLADGIDRAPSLVGIYGKAVNLANGEMRVVDEALIRQALPCRIPLP